MKTITEQFLYSPRIEVRDYAESLGYRFRVYNPDGFCVYSGNHSSTAKRIYNKLMEK